MEQTEFELQFEDLTGYQPMPWQTRLYLEYFDQARLPAAVDIPTGLGKTAVTALWLIALRAGRTLPRRLVYVVDRRAVVDQATDFVERLRERLPEDEHLPISTLRGHHLDNRQWLDGPTSPAIIVGTLDMIGSRLLFEGYGVSRRMRPYHAGLLGADTLIVLDEAHLVPAFERLLEDIERDIAGLGAGDDDDRALIPPLRLLSLSATGGARHGEVFRLADTDLGDAQSVTRRRLSAPKRLAIQQGDIKQRAALLAEAAWELADQGRKPIRCLVFCDSRDDAEKTCEQLAKLIKDRPKDDPERIKAEPPELFIGARRMHEREAAAARLASLGFLADADGGEPRLRFLIATSAAEVGVDLDADHMVCDLVAWDRMIQRLGRVNRRGDGDACIRVIDCTPTFVPKGASKSEAKRIEQGREQLRALLAALPPHDGGQDVSPAALREFKSQADPERAAAIALASSPMPLRPAISRALLDAWSMTSLREHTGRPEVAPWLRGWVDEEPRTVVVWREYLPVRPRQDNAQDADRDSRASEVNAFFSAAPIQLREQLETETYRVEKWLIARANALLKKQDVWHAKHPDAKDRPDGTALAPQQIVAMLLNGSREFVAALTLIDLRDLKKRGSRVRLANTTLVLQREFAGLCTAGTLRGNHADAPDWVADLGSADGSQPDPDEAPLVPWQIRPWDGQPPSDLGADWLVHHQFVLKRDANGEISAGLALYQWRQCASTEDDRSLAPRAQGLAEHQTQAADKAHAIGAALHLPERYRKVLTIAARLHDEGKQAERWQRAFNAPSGSAPHAKTRGPVNLRLLDGYRHEFGSLFHAEDDPEFRQMPDDDQALVLHLIAAHHGHARPTISVRGCDLAPPSRLAGRAREIARRFAALQRRWGPWGLAWWEALLRAADQQASKDNDRGQA